MFSASAIVRSLLAQHLGEFVEKDCLDSLTASLWWGQVALDNVRLKSSVLDSLGLPIRLRQGHVGRLEVTVPWTSIMSSSIVVRLDKVTLLCDAAYNFAEEIARAVAVRAAERETAQKKAEEVAKLAAQSVDGKAPDPGMLERLVTAVLDNLQVVLTNVHIRVEDRVTCPGHPFAYGCTAESFTAKVIWRVRGGWCTRGTPVGGTSPPCSPPPSLCATADGGEVTAGNHPRVRDRTVLVVPDAGGGQQQHGPAAYAHDQPHPPRPHHFQKQQRAVDGLAAVFY